VTREAELSSLLATCRDHRDASRKRNVELRGELDRALARAEHAEEQRDEAMRNAAAERMLRHRVTDSLEAHKAALATFGVTLTPTREN
jgi:hypothetical protein